MSFTNIAASRSRTINGRVAVSILIVFLLCAMTGCGDGLVRVYVDNGGKKVMTVSIDSQVPVTVSPGEFTRLRLEPGQRKFEITSAGQPVFSGTKTVELSKSYMFNPDFNNRYVSYEVEYGSNAFADAIARGAQKYAEEQSGKVLDETTREYVELANLSEAMPMSPWFEIPRRVMYVLTDPPEMVLTRTGTDQRVVLRRVSRSDHALVRAADGVKRASERDLDKLIEVTDRLEFGETEYTSYVGYEEEDSLNDTGADEEEGDW